MARSLLRGVRPFVALFVVVFVTACGGGGGGGGGGANAGSGGPPPVQRLVLNTTQLNFGAPATANAPPPQTLSGTVTGNPAAVFATVEMTRTGIDSNSAPQVAGSAISMQVLMRPAFLLGHGTYRDTITVRACPTAACTTQFEGSPATVAVTYVVGLDAQPESLAATAIEGAAPEPENVALSYFAGIGAWTTAVVYDTGSGWLTVPASGATLPATLAASFAPLPAGDYAATLSVTASGAAAETRELPVSYSVRPLLEVSDVAAIEVTNELPATDAAHARKVEVTSADPARNTAWTAVVDANAPWLRLDSAAGTTGGASTLELALVASEVAKLNNGRYAATVFIDPEDPNASTIEVPVTLNVERTHVATVAPYVAADGVEGDVYVRGTGFSDVTITDVRFGAFSAVGKFEIDGATRIRARHPALAPGRYPVTIVTDGPETVDSNAELVVVATVSYAAAGDIVTSELVRFATIAEFDPERRACYVASTVDPDPARIAAVVAGASSWTTQLSAGEYGPFIRGMALTADGRELLVALDAEIVHLDPATLIETRRTAVSAAEPSKNPLGGLARVDDGTAAFSLTSEIRVYRPWNRSDEPLLSMLIAGAIAPHTTGNKLLWSSGSGNTTYTVVDALDLTTSFTFDDTIFNGMLAASDRFGNRWAFTSQVPTQAFVTSAKGDVLDVISVNDANAVASAMSADGTKLALGFLDGFRFFDLTPLATGGTAVDLGSAPSVESNTVYNLHFTPHQDEVVSCGRGRVQAVAFP